jgi:hypothetical protein
MSDWDKELPRFKAKRTGQEEVQPVKGGKNRKKKPWKVFGPNWNGKEIEWYRGVDREACEKWIEKQRRSYYVPYRTAPARYAEDSKRRAEERANRYKIVGPK